MKSCVFLDFFFLPEFVFWLITTFNLLWCRAQDLFGSKIPMNLLHIKKVVTWTTWPWDGLADLVTTSYSRDLQFKPSCGHWSLRSKQISNTTPSQFETWLEVEVSQNLISLTFNFLKSYFLLLFFLKKCVNDTISQFPSPTFAYIFFFNFWQ